MNTPSCPLCDRSMVGRVNGDTRQLFWGCGAFPVCRGTLTFDAGVRLLVADGQRVAQKPAPKPKSKSKKADQMTTVAWKESKTMTVKEASPAPASTDSDSVKEGYSGRTPTASSARGQMSSFGSALAEGAVMGAADKANDIFIVIAKKMSSNSPIVLAALEDPFGREVVKMLAATMVRTTCLSAPGVIPQSEAIAALADMSLKFSTAKVTSNALGAVGEELAELARLGQSIAQLPAPSAAASMFGTETATAATKR